jgi:hypothetical protein
MDNNELSEGQCISMKLVQLCNGHELRRQSHPIVNISLTPLDSEQIKIGQFEKHSQSEAVPIKQVVEAYKVTTCWESRIF